MKYEKELSIMRQVAIEAGKLIMDVYTQEDFGIEIKADDSPVTRADQLANDYIVKTLKEHFPAYSILSEESKDDPSRYENDYVWIIDPLDGTKEFIKRNGEFSVNIALAYKKRPVAGVIYIPIVSELYYAHQGEGAYLEDELGNVTRIKVSDRKTNLCAVRSRSRVSEKLLAAYEDERVLQVKKVGSSLKGCKIARGEADIYYSLGFTMEWDTAAMELIVLEAGGIFRQLDHTIMEYNRQDNLNRKGFYILNHDDNKVM